MSVSALSLPPPLSLSFSLPLSLWFSKPEYQELKQKSSIIRLQEHPKVIAQTYFTLL